jgi:SagB-type dehydrogenase family enzyme
LVQLQHSIHFGLTVGPPGPGEKASAAVAAAVFAWTALPARTEWRYAEASFKVIALDAGHLCQNLYLACEAIVAGTCAIAAYRRELMDALLGVDGEEEFTVYLAPVGNV